MRYTLCFLALAAAAAVVCVSAQAPSPPPIWPVSFQARFGLDIANQNPPIVNSTCEFLYNLNEDVQGQLIVCQWGTRHAKQGLRFTHRACASHVPVLRVLFVLGVPQTLISVR